MGHLVREVVLALPLSLDYDTWVTYGLALIVIYMLVRAFLVPIRYLLTAAYRVAAGGLALWAINWAGAFIGFHLGLNLVTAGVVGFLGVPGFVLLVVLQRLAEF